MYRIARSIQYCVCELPVSQPLYCNSMGLTDNRGTFLVSCIILMYVWVGLLTVQFTFSIFFTVLFWLIGLSICPCMNGTACYVSYLFRYQRSVLYFIEFFFVCSHTLHQIVSIKPWIVDMSMIYLFYCTNIHLCSTRAYLGASDPIHALF